MTEITEQTILFKINKIDTDVNKIQKNRQQYS